MPQIIIRKSGRSSLAAAAVDVDLQPALPLPPLLEGVEPLLLAPVHSPAGGLLSARLQLVFHHLESFPKMKYNNQIITKSVVEKRKNYYQFC